MCERLPTFNEWGKRMKKFLGNDISIKDKAIYSELSTLKGLILDVVSISSNYSITTGNKKIFVSTASGNVTIALPDATAYEGYSYSIFKKDIPHAIILVPSVVGQLIKGSTSLIMLFQRSSLSLVSDGSNWFVQ
jgi:hypothetical protein